MQYESSFNFECGTRHEKYSITCLDNLYSGKTKYQNVNIFNTKCWGKVLVLDGQIQSALRDEHRYHESLVQPAMLAHPEPKNVLIIGGGEGATAREVLKHPTVQHCTMVDIDGELVELCEKLLPEWHQGSFADPRLELVIEDGIKFIEDSTETYDVIIIDVCDSFETGGPSVEFFNPSFYRKIKRILEIKGILVFQAMCASMQDNENFVEVYGGLHKAFTFANPYIGYVPSFWAEWGFVIASDVHNVGIMNSARIEDTIRYRGLLDKLRYFDERTMLNMFNIPKDIRALLEQELEKTNSEPEIVPDNTTSSFVPVLSVSAI